MSLWDKVGDVVLAHAANGIRQKELGEALVTAQIGPKGKSGITHLVAAMRAAGWLETSRRGREVFIFPGHVLTENRTRAREAERMTAPVRLQELDVRKLLRVIQPTLLRVRGATSLVREAVEFHQSNSGTYAAEASELHKALRKALARGTTNTNRLEDAYRQLLLHLNTKFYKACFHHFKIIGNYFDERGRLAKPRVCIKGNMANHQVTGDDQIIFTILRETEIGRETGARLFENTGFHEAARTGQPFILNDIPSAAAQGLYFNPRLDKDKVAHFWNKYHAVSRANRPAQAWNTCWQASGGSVEHPIVTSYQSTLIAPIIFSSEHLSSDLCEHLNIDGNLRHIMGFLCLDHVNVDYFDEHMDIDVCSALSGLLMPYLFTRLTLTRGSETFRTAVDKLDKSDMKSWMVVESKANAEDQINYQERPTLVPWDVDFFPGAESSLTLSSDRFEPIDSQSLLVEAG
ncbi:MAG: hypothetical protein HY255_11020 [Betaproteobacteria bacterium]|nr:hypothetical protein [Betaproteobacteria bacterium]